MDIIQTYCEQKYANRDEVLHDFDASIADVIWNEILQYRKQFRYEINIFLRPYELILCRSVLWQIQRVELMLYRFCLTSKEIEEMDAKWLALRQEYRYINTSSFAWMQMVCTRLHIEDSNKILSILYEELPFTIRLFLCAFLSYQTCPFALHLLFIKEDFPLSLAIMDLVLSWDVDACEHDMTYMFLRFLERLQLKLSDRMVLLKGVNQNEERVLELSALMERYPQLSKEALSFYVTHRCMGHYYTIQQYTAYCHVCYETARYSLDQLVNMRWYQKQKMGKKFVYYI